MKGIEEATRCENCQFWNRGVATMPSGLWKDYPAGDCKRHAPLVTGGLYGPVSTQWPLTAINDLCGDHSLAQDPTATVAQLIEEME